MAYAFTTRSAAGDVVSEDIATGVPLARARRILKSMCRMGFIPKGSSVTLSRGDYIDGRFSERAKITSCKAESR